MAFPSPIEAINGLSTLTGQVQGLAGKVGGLLGFGGGATPPAKPAGPDTKLVLGDITFAVYEIPERINFGGRQLLAEHIMLGGTKVVDAMGQQNEPVCWAGRFQGANAVERARHVDYLRKAGNPVTLSYDQFLYSVVIDEFEAQFERFYQVPYRISCCVVEDLTQPIRDVWSPPPDVLVQQDNATLQGIAGALGLPTLSSALGGVNTAVTALVGLTGGRIKALNKAAGAVQSAQTVVSGLIANNDNVLAQISTVGGVVAGAVAGKNVQSLINYGATLVQTANLKQGSDLLGRIGINLGLQKAP